MSIVLLYSFHFSDSIYHVNVYFVHIFNWSLTWLAMVILFPQNIPSVQYPLPQLYVCLVDHNNSYGWTCIIPIFSDKSVAFSIWSPWLSIMCNNLCIISSSQILESYCESTNIDNMNIPINCTWHTFCTFFDTILVSCVIG